MKKQGGFTLIELVVVIVILGILAVTAAPRFLNLQDDARRASVEGLRGAIAGAAGIIYGKSAIEGVENQPLALSLLVLVRQASMLFGVTQKQHLQHSKLLFQVFQLIGLKLL